MQLTDEPDKRCYPLEDHLLCQKCHLLRLGLPVTGVPGFDCGGGSTLSSVSSAQLPLSGPISQFGGSAATGGAPSPLVGGVGGGGASESSGIHDMLSHQSVPSPSSSAYSFTSEHGGGTSRGSYHPGQQSISEGYISGSEQLNGSNTLNNTSNSRGTFAYNHQTPPGFTASHNHIAPRVPSNSSLQSNGSVNNYGAGSTGGFGHPNYHITDL